MESRELWWKTTDRPQTFKEVVGQPDAVKQIKYILSQGWGGNVWWISGPRGTGKTTLARLIAKYKDIDTLRSEEEFGIQDNWGTEPYTQWFVKRLRTKDGFELFTSGLTLPGTCCLIDEAHTLPIDVVRWFSVWFEHEQMSNKAALIFTALRNDIDELSDEKKKDFEPFLARLIHIKLTDRVRPAFIENCKRIARAHGLDPDRKSDRQWRRFAEDCHGDHREMLERMQDGWLELTRPKGEAG